MNNKIAYNVQEATAALGIGRTSLYKLVSEGHLTPKKIGRRTLFLAEDLQRLLETETQP